MSTSALRIVLRSAAIVIAIAAVIDPVFSLERPITPPVVLIDMTDGSLDEIRDTLRERAAATVIERETTGHRIPCAPGERCVIVADGTVHADLPGDVTAPMLLIDREPASPNARLLSVIASEPHALAASSARIVIDAKGMTGSTTTVRLRDGELTVGSGRHEWKSDGTATLDVTWLPIAPGPRLLRVEATSDIAETSTTDNAVDVSIRVGGEPSPVLVFDTRPSWSSTFVRRALEDDPRFVVEHRARVAPALAAATPAGRLDTGALDRASVLIVGAPDGLSEPEVSLIERFVRVRGGTAILLPEREPSGRLSRLMPQMWTEQLIAEPQPVGSLRATEILRATEVPVGATVFATHAERPVIMLTPAGEGAVLVSGAMDAWRYRAEDGAFGRFWTSVAAQSASTSRALQIEFDNRPAMTGTRHRFHVRARSIEPSGAIEASAIARCGQTAEVIRLWPEAAASFVGELAVAHAATCEVDVSVGALRASSGIAVAGKAALATSQSLRALEQMVARAGGTVARVDGLASTTVFDTPRASERSPFHPLRSPWWILPFALCLSGEWWLRRRDGLR
jgi:hypothetical protein